MIVFKKNIPFRALPYDEDEVSGAARAYGPLNLFGPGACSGLHIFFENSEEPFERKTYLLI